MTATVHSNAQSNSVATPEEVIAKVHEAGHDNLFEKYNIKVV